MMNETTHRLADAAAGATWVAYGVSSIEHFNEVAQSVALVVAILSGVFAGLYHATRWLQIVRGAR